MKGTIVRNLLANRIMTPDGTIIESNSVHDFVSHTDKNGYTYAVDGGLSYTRRVWDSPVRDYVEMSVYTDDLHSVIRDTFKWGTYGPKGDQPKTYVKLKNMSIEHIQAILKTQHHIPDYIRKVFTDELDYRFMFE